MTRLLVFVGDRIAMYDGKEESHVWDTGGIPADKGHYETLEPQVWSLDWLGEMKERGRRFDAFTTDLAVL